MNSLLEGANNSKDDLSIKLKEGSVKIIDVQKENKILKENTKKIMEENYSLKNENIKECFVLTREI